MRLRPASTLGFPSHQPSGQRVPLTPIHLCLNPGSNYSPSPASSVCLYISLSSPKFKASSPVCVVLVELYEENTALHRYVVGKDDEIDYLCSFIHALLRYLMSTSPVLEARSLNQGRGRTGRPLEALGENHLLSPPNFWWLLAFLEKTQKSPLLEIGLP
ncbi:single-pass membrane and coiled-coil domain-containing protein 4 isoform 1-T1 [Hipposideros larvatus]